jgi:threonine/homoserine/homoserine lactone efflux protein
MLRSALAFAVFAAVLTITPGMDSLLVLRTTAVSGSRAGLAAAAGIMLGCLGWATASAAGVTALLAASRPAFDGLRLAGAAYLCWLGFRALRSTRRRPPVGQDPRPVRVVQRQPAAGPPDHRPRDGADPDPAGHTRVRPWRALRIGLTTNALNPKVGVFYVSVLPQFLPRGVNPFLGSLLLAGVHVVEGVIWLSLLVALAEWARGWLRRPVVKRRLEQLTGLLFIGFGVRLALLRVG